MIDRRWHGPVLAAAILAIGSLLVASPGPAVGSNGPCPGTTGVTVVVDDQALGGGAVVRCAPGSPASGFKALAGAGFQAVQAGAGFLCRIDGKPDAGQEDCANTPPPTAYWSYWHADRGGSWVYSPWGADHKPAAGSVEGWSFHTGGGAASPPGVAPPDPAPKPTATPKPTPKPTAKPTASPRPTGTGTSSARPTVMPTPDDTPHASATAAPAAPSAQPSPSVTPETPAASASPVPASPDDAPASETPTPSLSGGAIAAVDGAGVDGAATTAGGGPPLGTVVGIVLVALIGGAAVSARRRRTGAGDG